MNNDERERLIELARAAESQMQETERQLLRADAELRECKAVCPACGEMRPCIEMPAHHKVCTGSGWYLKATRLLAIAIGNGHSPINAQEFIDDDLSRWVWREDKTRYEQVALGEEESKSFAVIRDRLERAGPYRRYVLELERRLRELALEKTLMPRAVYQMGDPFTVRVYVVNESLPRFTLSLADFING